MSDNRSAAEVYADRLREMRADVGFRSELMLDGSIRRQYSGPRGEAGVQPIYLGQVPERQESE